MKYTALIFLFVANFSFAQSSSLSKVMDKIDYQGDTLQAVYDWVTDNIKYDVGKLKKLEKGENFYKKGNYKNTVEYKADLLEKVIKKKKGVCDDYTLLFNALVSELGYTSHIISGVTKDKSGRIRKGSSHSWMTVKVDGVWKLFDPTWGAGYVNDKRKFVKKYFAKWYDVDTEKMKETHFPFDPIWQLSGNPMTFQEFKKGKQAENKEGEYDFAGMINEHFQKEEKAQYVAMLERSKLNGGNISRIKKYRTHLQKKIDFQESANSTSVIQSTIDENRKASKIFSEYFKAKNNRFKGETWTMEYAKNALTDIQERMEQSISTFESIEVKGAKSKKSLKSLISKSKDMNKRVEKELKFLDGKM